MSTRQIGHTLLMRFPAIMHHREARRGRIIVGWSTDKEGANSSNLKPGASGAPHLFSPTRSAFQFSEPGRWAVRAEGFARSVIGAQGIGCACNVPRAAFDFGHKGAAEWGWDKKRSFRSFTPADRGRGALACFPKEGRSVSSSSRAATSEAL